MKKTLFPLGSIVATPGALDLLEQLGENPMTYLSRHARGDWGDLCDDDKAENDFSVPRCLRILSAYKTPKGKLWVITEADRSATTLLLPDEY